MAKIVVMGAGLGGMPMAFEMQDLARKEDSVTVIFRYKSDPDPRWYLLGTGRPGTHQNDPSGVSGNFHP